MFDLIMAPEFGNKEMTKVQVCKVMVDKKGLFFGFDLRSQSVDKQHAIFETIQQTSLKVDQL